MIIILPTSKFHKKVIKSKQNIIYQCVVQTMKIKSLCKFSLSESCHWD